MEQCQFGCLLRFFMSPPSHPDKPPEDGMKPPDGSATILSQSPGALPYQAFSRPTLPNDISYPLTLISRPPKLCILVEGVYYIERETGRSN